MHTCHHTRAAPVSSPAEHPLTNYHEIKTTKPIHGTRRRDVHLSLQPLASFSFSSPPYPTASTSYSGMSVVYHSGTETRDQENICSWVGRVSRPNPATGKISEKKSTNKTTWQQKICACRGRVSIFLVKVDPAAPPPTSFSLFVTVQPKHEPAMMTCCQFETTPVPSTFEEESLSSRSDSLQVYRRRPAASVQHTTQCRTPLHITSNYPIFMKMHALSLSINALAHHALVAAR